MLRCLRSIGILTVIASTYGATCDVRGARAASSSAASPPRATESHAATAPAPARWTLVEDAVLAWSSPSPAGGLEPHLDPLATASTRPGGVAMEQEAPIREITVWFDGHCADARSITPSEVRTALVNTATASFGVASAASGGGVSGRPRVGRAVVRPSCAVLRADVSATALDDARVGAAARDGSGEPSGSMVLAAFVPSGGRVRLRVRPMPGSGPGRVRQMITLVDAAVRSAATGRTRTLPSHRTTVVTETLAAALYEPSTSSSESPDDVTEDVARHGTPTSQNAPTAGGQIRFALQGDDAVEMDRAVRTIRRTLSHIEGVDVVATSDNDARASGRPTNHSVVAQSIAGATVGTVVSGDHRTALAIRPPRFVTPVDPLSTGTPTTMPRALNINMAVELRTERQSGDASGIVVRRVVTFFVTPRRRHARLWSDAVRLRITNLTLPDSCSIDWL